MKKPISDFGRRYINQAFQGGVHPSHSIETRRRILMINTISFIGILNLFPLGIAALFTGKPVLGILDIVLGSLLVILQINLRRTHNPLLISHIGVFAAAGLYGFLLITGGVDQSGHVWFFTFPLIAMFLLGKKIGTRMTLILLVCSGIIMALLYRFPNTAHYSINFLFRFALAFFVVFLYAYFFEAIRLKTQEQLTSKNVQLEDTIAEIKKTQCALEESEAKYRNLIDRANDGIVLIQDRLIKYANPRLSELTGYSEDELLESKFTKYLAVYEKSNLEKMYQKHNEGEPITAIFDSVICHKNGSKLNVELNGGLVSIQGKAADLVIIRDISERKKYEHELQRAKSEAEAANKAKSGFLASMSHELRTPLNHIIGFTDMLINEYYGELNSKQDECLEDILNSGKYLLSLINDVLDLSKVEAGKMELQLSRFKIHELVESSLFMIKEKCISQGIKLTFEAAENVEELEVKADQRRLKQVLYNLLSNAAKFTPERGFISVKLEKNGKNVKVSVQDSGVGIEKIHQQYIFNSFSQIDSEMNAKTQGTGLGLPLSRNIIEMHAGRIWVESEGQGKGSSFIFTIPLTSLT